MIQDEIAIRFLPLAVAAKLFVSLGIGLLVGFEREWSGKDPGVRTFAIISLLGMLTALEGDSFALAGMTAVLILVGLMNIGSLWIRRELETTTSAAMIVTFVLGVLVGKGHVFTPTASAILMTLLLALKPQLSRFAGTVTAAEVRGAILLGLIGFVIYPLLPDRTFDPWKLFNPREEWITVILLAGISFINYVLLRLYSTQGLYYTAIFGGLVNSTATIAELSTAVASTGAWHSHLAMTITILTIISMFVRNLAVLAVFSPAAGMVAFWPILAMCLCALVFTFHRDKQNAEASAEVTLSSPISIKKIATFAFFFLAIKALGASGQRFFGEYGTIAVSFLGGFVSSASATAAVGSLAHSQQIATTTAAVAVVLTSVASAIVNVPIIYRASRDRAEMWRLLAVSVAITVAGLVVLGIAAWFGVPGIHGT